MVEKQETSELNLQYLIATPDSAGFPWKAGIVCLIFFGTFAFAGWLFYQSRHKQATVLHRVSEGDTLRTLALQYYGNPRDWHKIYLANRKQLLAHKKIVAGQKLVIPLSYIELEKIMHQRSSPCLGQDAEIGGIPCK